jgi:hypothetical protein
MHKRLMCSGLLALAIGAISLSPILAGEATPAPDEISRLRAENDALRSAVQRFAKENTALTLEVKRLLAILEKAGIEAKEQQPPIPSTPPSADIGATKDGNAVVAEAIGRYRLAMRSMATSNDTDIQKKAMWLAANRQLGEALRKNKITIEYVVKDVQFRQPLIYYPGREYRQNLAYIRVGPGVIRFTDPSIPDASIEPPPEGLHVPMSQEDALGVKASSLIKVSGWCALNVRFDVPIENQPAFYSINSLLVRARNTKEAQMQGYQLLGTFTGDPDGAHWPWPCLVVQDDCIVEVNGVRRGLYIAPLGPEIQPPVLRPSATPAPAGHW